MISDRNDLDHDPKMQQLYYMVSPSSQTWNGYLNAMLHYSIYANRTPSELISMAELDQKNGKTMTEREIFQLLPRFRQYLESQKSPMTGAVLAPGTINLYMSKVISFYKYNYIEVPIQPRSKARTRSKKENIKTVGKEVIRDALEHCNVRDKAIVLCGVSSGMAATELSSLTLKAFKEGYDPETGITTFDMRRQKVGVDFITFISPEASQAVIQYLEWRDRPVNSDNEDEFIRRRTTDDSYLFVSNNVFYSYFYDFDEERRRLPYSAIKQLYRRISKNAGFNSQRGIYNPFRSHNMRKFFNSTLKNNGCDGDLIEYFMGHSLGDTKATYYEGDPEKLKEIYMKFFPYLTISKEFDLSESPEYQKVVSDNEILTKVNAQNVVKLDKVGDLESKINEMEKRQAIYDEMMTTIAENPKDVVEIMSKLNKNK